MHPIAWKIKRVIDVVASLIGLILLSPILVILGLLVVVDSGWPPLYVHERIGRFGKPFRLYKYRSLVVNAANIGAGLWFEKDDPRVTRVGKFLRRSSMDELSQLLNVLKGDMSLVGPRPGLAVITDKFTAAQQRRHVVPPGITGWQQINGRNELTWSQRVELDLWYIDNWSLWLDLLILLRTVGVVVSAAGMRIDQAPEEVDDL